MHSPRAGGWAELWRLAWPLILANSFWTLQITIDRIFLGQLVGSEAVGAAMAAALVFWTPLTLLSSTAAYATTFVAQYVGAGRPHRVGPAIWQAIYFSLATGVAFLGLVPFASDIIGWLGHSDSMQAMEVEYYRCLCWSALPTLLVAAGSSFFTGRGDSRTVMLINGVGLVGNAVFDYLWVPIWGVAGAGWATVVGTWMSAAAAMLLIAQPVFRERFATLSGWRLDRQLLYRLCYYGLPSGLQWALDGLAFTIFLVFVGRMGDAELAATSIAFTLNMVAFLPALGLGQAVSVLVGQRLGEDKPDLAERSTWTGFKMAWIYMTIVAIGYVLLPDALLWLFRPAGPSASWAEVEKVAPLLLKFVAVYSLFDSMNLIFSFALKGAGDTRFVTLVALILSWPVMVLPTWLAYRWDGGLIPAWVAASTYIILQALLFLWRFRLGYWRSMRVIEQAPVLLDDVSPAEGTLDSPQDAAPPIEPAAPCPRATDVPA